MAHTKPKPTSRPGREHTTERKPGTGAAAPGIISPNAAEPATPVTTAGSSGLLSATMRDSGTYGAADR